ncbi:response regulator transcription factor [Actinoplanes ianthinogenes]|uniref:response regulator transcription factor n=1 Tax=Actinoplanes ianthinogenes TaxID=122358 RepID=UPI00167081C7|nr:response regulator transcription factor [Actinoplanes ianthinogenes]
MASTSAVTGVLVVEDQRTLADALRIGIDAQPDLECVGAVDRVDDALRLIATGHPDVVLMDIHLPGTDGVDGTRQVKAARPATRVLILTADPTPGLLAAAVAAGATGFLGKDTPFADILAAIRSPAGGKMIVEGEALAALARARSSREGRPATLTARETDILALMGDGLDPRAIAARLVISVHTVRGHVKQILRKLGAHSQLEAVVTATRTGLLKNSSSGGSGQPR